MTMYRFQTKLFVFFSLLTFGSNALAQNLTLGDDGYIIVFSPFYASNLVDLNSSANDLYILKNAHKNSVKTDILFCNLSKKSYISFSSILDTLSKEFEIYKVANNRFFDDKKNLTSILEYFENYNNYLTGYLYHLNNEGAVTGYIVQKYSGKKRIWYRVIKSIDPVIKYEAIIYRME